MTYSLPLFELNVWLFYNPSCVCQFSLSNRYSLITEMILKAFEPTFLSEKKNRYKIVLWRSLLHDDSGISLNHF